MGAQIDRSLFYAMLSARPETSLQHAFESPKSLAAF